MDQPMNEWNETSVISMKSCKPFVLARYPRTRLSGTLWLSSIKMHIYFSMWMNLFLDFPTDKKSAICHPTQNQEQDPINGLFRVRFVPINPGHFFKFGHDLRQEWHNTSEIPLSLYIYLFMISPIKVEVFC